MFEVTTSNLRSAMKGEGQGRPMARMATAAVAGAERCHCDSSKCSQAGSMCLQGLLCPGPKGFLAGPLNEAQGKRCGQAKRAHGTVGSQVGEGWSLRLALCPQAWASHSSWKPC